MPGAFQQGELFGEESLHVTKLETCGGWLVKSRKAPFMKGAHRTRQKRAGIVYGTWDLTYDRHYDFLEHAQKHCDHLVVSVATDACNAAHGKRTLYQSVIGRLEWIKHVGFGIDIVLEEYDGKVNDVQKYNIDVMIFRTDWQGSLEYVRNLCQYCELPFLGAGLQIMRPLRKIGIIAQVVEAPEFREQAAQKAGAVMCDLSSVGVNRCYQLPKRGLNSHHSIMDGTPDDVGALYIAAHSEAMVLLAREALHKQKNVLCDNLLAAFPHDIEELFTLAAKKKLVLLASSAYAYRPAFERLAAIAQNGKIGRILSVLISYTATFDTTELGRQERDTTDALLAVARVMPRRDTPRVPVRLSPEPTFYQTACMATYHLASGDTDAILEITSKPSMSTGEIVVIGSKGSLRVPGLWWEADSFELHLNAPDPESGSADLKQVFHVPSRKGGFRYDIAEFVSLIEGGSAVTSHKPTPRDCIAVAEYREALYAEQYKRPRSRKLS